MKKCTKKVMETMNHKKDFLNTLLKFSAFCHSKKNQRTNCKFFVNTLEKINNYCYDNKD